MEIIEPEIESDLFPVMAGTARNHGSRILSINGTTDHVHMLLSLSKTEALSDTVMEIKKASSSWIKTMGSRYRDFYWQDGYAGFSIGQSGVKDVKEYIANQKVHHRRRSFKQEIMTFLKRYEIEYDERYLWE